MVHTVDAQSLLAAAKEAAAHAWAPYSQFPVGCALVTDDGRTITGCNVENASFGLTICAERNAVTTMIATGTDAPGTGTPTRPVIEAIAIVGLKAAPCHPCGACRQVLHEFSCKQVIVEDPATGEPVIYPFEDLLPHAFGPDDL